MTESTTGMSDVSESDVAPEADKMGASMSSSGMSDSLFSSR